MLGDLLQYPEKIPLARLSTPLQYLSRLSRAWGRVNIWIKRDDLTGALLSGNKVRKLEYVLYRAKKLGAVGVVTAGAAQSNHCRSTAIACAQLGLKCYLLLRRTDDVERALNTGNCFLSSLSGAEIIWVAPNANESTIKSHMTDLIQAKSKQGERLHAVPIGASDELGLWGYVECARELAKDCSLAGIEPSWMFCASGSSGTQAGLTLGSYLYGLSSRVVGMAVCDNRSYFEKRVRHDVRLWLENQATWVGDVDTGDVLQNLSIYCDDRFIGGGYGEADEKVLSLIQEVAQLEGIVLDPVYTAKAMQGLKCWIKEGKIGANEDVLFVHTGGAFGLFPFSELFHSNNTVA